MKKEKVIKAGRERWEMGLRSGLGDGAMEAGAGVHWVSVGKALFIISIFWLLSFKRF